MFLAKMVTDHRRRFSLALLLALLVLSAVTVAYARFAVDRAAPALSVRAPVLTVAGETAPVRKARSARVANSWLVSGV
jgi:hypothetical protein